MILMIIFPNLVTSGEYYNTFFKKQDSIFEKNNSIFSKMTFACLSQATATSKRVFYQTQNTFNRIQNTFITDEIHDQGKNLHFPSVISRNTCSPAVFGWFFMKTVFLTQTKQYTSADSSFCWAFALSTMIRHSVHFFLGQLTKERPMRFDSDKIYEATKFLNDLEFHKRLRIGSNRAENSFNFRKFLWIFEWTEQKKRVDNDTNSKTKIFRKESANWPIRRRLFRWNYCKTNSYSSWCYWSSKFFLSK